MSWSSAFSRARKKKSDCRFFDIMWHFFTFVIGKFTFHDSKKWVYSLTWTPGFYPLGLRLPFSEFMHLHAEQKLHQRVNVFNNNLYEGKEILLKLKLFIYIENGRKNIFMKTLLQKQGCPSMLGFYSLLGKKSI